MRGRRWSAAGTAAVLSLGSLLVGTGHAAATSAGSALNFTQLGHDALYDRGENAAPALYDNGTDTYIYVGSRSDGTHLHSGVEIVKATEPANPTTVGEIALPAKLTLGYTSRELRVWPQQKMLVVMYFGCSALIHACASGSDTGLQPLRQFDFFDLTNPASPALVSTYTPSTTPHEMFLWVDPVNAGRALLYWTSPNNATKQLVVTDISGWRQSTFRDVATFSATALYTQDEQNNFDVRLHSLSVTPDGNRTYLAYLGGGVLVVDSSDVAKNVTFPVLRLVTPVEKRAFWNYEGAHSAVTIPGSHYLFTTEEIYGKGTPVMQELFGPAFGGCPWGWARIIDASDETNLSAKPPVEYRIAENQPDFCATVSAPQDNYSSYASHNPTVLPHLALVTWHSAGLQAIDLTDPTQPTQAGYFVAAPDGPAANHTPDPALEAGSDGVIAWSYPIIHNGVIWFSDIRNGLYSVTYSGLHADEVNGVSLYEGNSNVGDAQRLAVPAAPAPTASAAEAPGAALVGLVGILGACLVRARRGRRHRSAER